MRADARQLLDHGTYPAIATHDEDVIGQVRQHAATRGMAADRLRSW